VLTFEGHAFFDKLDPELAIANIVQGNLDCYYLDCTSLLLSFKEYLVFSKLQI
jgi:hypothetical protein